MMIGSLQMQEEVRYRVQSFLKNSRMELDYSIAEACHLLQISEERLVDYETGKKSPPCHLLVHIIQTYQASPSLFLQNMIDAYAKKGALK